MAQDIKGLLFDKDGTLFDFHATWGSWTAGFIRDMAGFGADPARLSAAMGFDLETQSFDPESAVIAGTPDDTIDAVMAALPELGRDQVSRHIIESSAAAPLAEAVPLAPFLDDLLARGLILGVATNDAEDVAESHLNAAGVRDRFAFVAGYDSGHGAKPAPGMQRAFLAQSGLAPAQVAMVGDSTHDLISGQRAGMITIGVLTGTAPRPVLTPHATVVLDDIGQIPAWLTG